MANRLFIFTLFFFSLSLFLSPVDCLAEGKGFFPGGELKWEYVFQDGAISEAKWYSEEGLLISRELYTDGQTEKTEGYRPDGTLEWQVRKLEGNRQEVIRFDESGQKITKYQTLDDQPDGEHTTFYSDGSTKQTVTYQMGVLEGPARTYFPNGQTEHEFSYSNGEVDGTYRTYSEAGTLLTEYTFSSGQLQ